MLGRISVVVAALAASTAAQISFVNHPVEGDYTCAYTSVTQDFPTAAAGQCINFGITTYSWTSSAAPQNDQVSMFTEPNCQGDEVVYHFAFDCTSYEGLKPGVTPEGFQSFQIV